jgi:very-short-patch-repair endonuclease
MLRFTNDEVLNNIDDVLMQIKKKCLPFDEYDK